MLCEYGHTSPRGQALDCWWIIATAIRGRQSGQGRKQHGISKEDTASCEAKQAYDKGNDTAFK
jgi:hypothetical protein